MVSAAISAFGTLLQIGDGGGPESFTTVAEVRDISGPALSGDEVEVTHQASPGAFREFLPGLLDGGEVTFDINWLIQNATQSFSSGILKDMTDRVKRNYKLIFTDGAATEWVFPAIVTGYEPDNSLNGAAQASITLRMAGQPTLA